MGIAASLLAERMLEERALQEAGRSHPLDQLEVLARLLLVPARAAGRERHQVERRIVDRVANDAPGVAGALGEEDRLYFFLEELVIQRFRCGGGSGGLAPRRPQ